MGLRPSRLFSPTHSSQRLHRRQVQRDRRWMLELESLETRLLLTATALDQPYLVPQHYLMVPNGYLTAPQSGDALAVARSYMEAHASDLGLTLDDLLNAA